MAIVKEKYIGNSPLIDVPKKKLALVIKDGSITERKLAPNVILALTAKVMEALSELLPEGMSLEELFNEVVTLKGQMGGYTLSCLSEVKYEALLRTGTVDKNTIYFITANNNDWVFGDPFPIVFTDAWTFGSAFPVVLSNG